MSDLDQTVYSKQGAQGMSGAQPPPSASGGGRNPLLIMGGIGCILLLCIVLLAVVIFVAAGDRLTELTGFGGEATTVVEAPTVEAAPSATPTEEPTVEVKDDTGGTDEATPTDTPVINDEPVIEQLTFALGATDAYDPINPGTTFEEGITEIHAIFDYSGMLPDSTWERVWYLDGDELLRNSATWTDKEQGRFDYFIDAGGDPLAAGQWTLELYVNDELLAMGSFTIEAEETAEVAQATATPEPEEEATATPAPAKPSSSGGGVYQLVYTKWDGGQHNIYIADTNGSNEQFIMSRASGPSWTPDGGTIFFYGWQGVDRQERGNHPGVQDCQLPGVSDGIVAIEVPSPPADVCAAMPQVFQGSGWNDGTARWASVSPDGQMVAYDGLPSGNWRIYFLGTADNQQFKFEIIGEVADWSPDSQKVVYRSGRDGITGIWISNRDDTGHTNITQNGSDSFPAWSPDGETIAFSREVDGNVDIYTMNIDGSNIQRLTDAPGPDSLPIYTPSGDIIFRSARSGDWGIWKMSGTGGNQIEIIANAGVGPDWAYSKMDVR